MERREGGIAEEAARDIFGSKGLNILGVEAVIDVLSIKGIKIVLTEEERERSKNIPWTEETLRMASARGWRGRRAILCWAPPERYGITMLKLMEAFGTSKDSLDVQPRIYASPWRKDNEEWSKKEFAKKVLREGWHLTLAEMLFLDKCYPREGYWHLTAIEMFLGKKHPKQKSFLTEDEELLTPVETMYLVLFNYMINNGERLLAKGSSRTDTTLTNGRVVGLGDFGAENGLKVGDWHPFTRSPRIGALIGRRPEV